MKDENFLHLLRCALWGEKFDRVLTEAEWVEVWNQACRHCVWAFLFDVVKELPAESGIPELLVAKWAEGTRDVERRNAEISRIVSYQKAMFEKEGIEAVQLKGLMLSRLYPVPEHRFCGDIDWWFPKDGDWDKASAVMEKAGAKLRLDSDGDLNYRANGIVVEHHQEGYALSGKEGELLLLVEHIFHHAAVMGIGVRQLCDLALAYSELGGKYKAETFVKALEERGLLKFAVLLNAALRDCFGLDASALPFSTGKLRQKNVERFMTLVLSDGNFGLDKAHRTAGFFKRFFIVGKFAPKAFAARWLSLFKGRLRRLLCKSR